MDTSGDKNVGKSTSLFPAYQQTTAPSKSQNLFPVSLAPSDPEKRIQEPDLHETQPKTLDWLSFSSFKTEDALAIHNIQSSKNSKDVAGNESNDFPDNEKSIAGSIRSTNIHDKSDKSDSGDDTTSDVEVIKEEGKRKKKKSKEKKKHRAKEKHKHKKHKKEHSKRDEDSYEEYMSRHAKKRSIRDKQKEIQLPHILIGNENAVFIEDVKGLTPDKAFRIYKKPSRNNFTCGNMYKMDIAKYEKRPLLLGASNTNFKNKTKRDKNKKSKFADRYFGKEKLLIIRTMVGKSVKSVDPPQRKSRFSDIADNITSQTFIPIVGGENDSANSTKLDNPLGIYDQATALYISGREAPDSVVSTDCGDSSVTQPTFEQISIRKKTANYNQRLKANSSDIDLWLEFIQFQDEVAISEQPYERTKAELELNAKGKRLNLDIKLAILERALKENPSSLILKMKHLEMCKDVWTKDKLKSEWKALLFTHTNNPEVWKLYLNYQLSNFTNFSVPSVMKAFEKCIFTLKGVLGGTLLSHQPMDGTLDAMLEIYIKLCFILKETGHTEKGVALFQAMIEFNLFCPDLLGDVSKQDKMDFLEAFWETPVGRLGEKNARGWNTYVEAKGEVPTCQPFSASDILGKEDRVEEEVLAAATERSNKWRSLEMYRSRNHWLPWRPDVDAGQDDEDCEDPERLVLFDDVKTLLFSLETEQQMFLLVLAFLRFLSCDLFECRSFASQVCKSVIDTNSGVDIFASVSDFDVRLGDEFSFADLETFMDNVFTQVITRFKDFQRIIFTRLWALNKFQALIRKTRDLTDKKIIKGHVKEFKKSIKSVLKEEENRNNLLLWETFALCEYKLGNKEEAGRILQTALSMFRNDTSSQTDNLSSLLIRKLQCTHIDFEMDSVGELSRLPLNFSHSGKEVNKERILGILCGIADGSNTDVSPARLLRCKNKYQQDLFQCIDDYDQENKPVEFEDELRCRVAGHDIIHLTKCYALFQYLTVNVKASSVVFLETLSKLKPFTPYVTEHPTSRLQWCLYETCMSNYLSLLRFHVEKHISPLSALRVPLQQALADMPENQQLLSLYASLESKSFIVCNLRRYFHKACASAVTLTPWLCILSAEVLRQDSIHNSTKIEQVSGETGLSHQIRAWFERATKHKSAMHSSQLWRLYMKFEKQQGCDKESRDVFYRSLQQCPWAKMLYVDYVEYFPGQFREVCDLLVEKELRVRVPPEELDILVPLEPKTRPDPRLHTEDTDDEDNDED